MKKLYKLKIAIFTNNFPPITCGVGDYSFHLATYLSKQKHEVQVFCSAKSEIVKKDFGNHPFHVSPFIISWGKKDISGLVNKITSNKPDYIILQYVPYSFSKYGIAWNIANLVKNAKKKGIKIITTVHEPYIRWDDSYNPKHLLTALLQRFVMRRILKKCIAAFTSTTHYAELLNKYSKNIIINRIPPNIIPAATNNFEDKKNQYLNKIEVSRLIVIFGERNISQVIEVIRTINKLPGQIKTGILVVGKVREQKYKNEPFVYYTGILASEEVAVFLQMADLFVLPERVYKNNRGGASFKSGALAAALATPLPILSSKGDMTDAPPLQHGKNIWFTNFNNQQQLQKDIIHLLSNPDLLNHLKKGAIEIYNNYLTWEIVGSKYMEIINERQ